MHWPLVPHAAVLTSLVAVGTATLLPGCACNPNQGSWYSSGQIETKNAKPFTLSTKEQRRVIAPGDLTITPVANDCAPRLEIGDGSDKLTLRLHRGELTGNEIRIVGVTHGLSANIVGTWHDIAQGRPHESYGSESCTRYGHCWKEETEKECHDGKCKTETHSKYGWYSDCPGSRPVTIRYDDFKRAYRIDFLNPQNTREQFGRYEGLTPPFELEIGRSSGACQ